jgi:8-oxo-dGTP diphosphatase
MVGLNPDMAEIIDFGFRQAYRIAYPLIQIVRPFYHQDGVCTAVWAHDRLLVVRHSYKPGVSIPGGGVKAGEDSRRGAARELCEEVGITVAPSALKLIHSKRFRHHRGTNYFYEVQIETVPSLKIDRREIIYAEFLTPTEIMLLKCDQYLMAYLEAHTKTTKNDIVIDMQRNPVPTTA